jgi:hypothetical protein
MADSTRVAICTAQSRENPRPPQAQVPGAIRQELVEAAVAYLRLAKMSPILGSFGEQTTASRATGSLFLLSTVSTVQHLTD